MNNTKSILFENYQLGNLTLSNRTVMSPMTRSRATADHIPTDIMAEYYAQRSAAGLIITEGTAPSPNGTGYPRIPGIYNNMQVRAWNKVTDAVHAKGGKIFVQLMHTGRISHPLNMPENSEVLAPSAIPAGGTKMYTDQKGEKELPTPKAMTREDIHTTIDEFVKASENAVEAGFDGVELHGANGYLLEQFLFPGANNRDDEYGGSIENRARYVLEVAKKTANAIGKDKVGIRLSPFGAFNEITAAEDEAELYNYLSSELGKAGLLYIHIVDHSGMGTPEVPRSIKESIRDNFGGPIILSGGYDREKAEKDLEEGLGHLVAYGKPFLANPDLVERLKKNAPLNNPDFKTLYTPGEKGYTDYPRLEEVGQA